MIYWQLAPALISATLILIVPGLVVARSAGARGWLLAGTAGPTSVTLIALTAIATGFLHLPWSVFAVVINAIIVAVMVAVGRFHYTRRRKPNLNMRKRKSRVIEAPRLVSVMSLVVPFSLILWRFGEIIGQPGNISQTFDNIFHLNAIRYIEDTGRASSLLVAGFTSSSGQAGFYPAAWHDFVSLVAQVSGTAIPESVNATNMIVASVLWPLSAMLLVVTLFGSRTVTLLASGVLVSGFASFPYLMVDFGVLYPNFLSIAMLPAAIALTIGVLHLGKNVEERWTLGSGLLIAVLPGLALAHPSTLLALMPWTLPAVATATYRRVKDGAEHTDSLVQRWMPVLALFGYTAVMVILWKSLRPDESMSTWEPIQSLSQAIGQAISSAPISGPVPWAIFMLTIAGIFALVKDSGSRWYLGVFLVSCLAFVVVSGANFGPLRTFVGGIWYNDPYRPAALLPVAALPVAVYGATLLWDSLAKRANSITLPDSVLKITVKPPKLVIGALGVCIVLLFIGAVQRGAVTFAVSKAAQNYKLDAHSPLLSADEWKLLSRVPNLVAPQNTLIASPWTGASLVYALADRRSLTAHVFGTYDDSTGTVLQHLDEMSSDPRVCQAVQSLQSYYVLDFGTAEVHGQSHPFPGTSGLTESRNFDLVDSEGAAKLYRVTGCDGS
ncbi:UNVERIFIED_ORG: hypothetical protein ABIB19_000002 [Arthrobacter sp. UYEF10]